MDLPKLTTFTTGEDSFYSTESLILSATPFTNGTYTRGNNAFYSLSCNGVVFDNPSMHLTELIIAHITNCYVQICDGDLVISEETECANLTKGNWNSITVKYGICNSLTSDLTIFDNHCLMSIILSDNSLKNVTSLTLKNNTRLTTFETGSQSFYYTSNVSLSSSLKGY